MRKRIWLATTAVLLLAVSLFTVGCGGPDPEEVIREDVTKELDLIKDTESDEYQELVDMMDSSMSAAGVDAYGLSGEEFVASMFDGYDYEIDSIDVDKDAGTATVEVKVTCKSIADMETAMYDEAYSFIEEVYADPGQYMGMSEDELNAKAGELIMTGVDGTEPRETDLTLEYEENDGDWEPVDDPFNELATCFQ